MEKFTYSDAIEKVMLENNYIAPLKLIYKEIWKYKDNNKLKGKTPENTIQERVQRDPKFTKIGLGVYALTEFLDKIKSEKEEFQRNSDIKTTKHSEIQGKLIEIGNYKKDIENTYTNDKSHYFNEKKLGSIITMNEVPKFTFEKILSETVRFFDVIWFNERNFPDTVFEVEHSTNFRDALVKFSELQYFTTRFYCVAEEDRKVKFEKELNKSAFSRVRDRVKFYSYEQVDSDYDLTLKKGFLL